MEYTLPAQFPPPGITSDFVHPVTRGKDLIIACTLCISLMTVCVAVRFYTKIFIKHAWGWDDWVCIPATIGSISFAAVALSTLGSGVGPHQWDVPFTAFTPSLLRRFVVLDMLYSPSILMAKLSLLLLYLQIFHPKVWMRNGIILSMITVSLFYTATFVLYGVFSIPRPGQTQLESILSINTAKDIPLGITQGAFSVVSDFYIFCLPIPGVWKLQLPPRKKVGVLAIFMTGLLACIAGAFGLYYRVHLSRNSDVTWKLVFVLLWVVIELTVGVMCSCLTTFPGFFRYHLPLLRSIASLFNSSFKSLHTPKIMSRSTNPSSAKRLATEDIKVTLGSRIDGKGHFMNPTSVFAMDPNRLPLSEAIHSPLTSVDEANATPRDHYEEIAEMQHAPARHLLSTGNPSFQSSTGDSPHEDAELGLVGQKLPPCEHLQASRSKPSRLGKLRGWIIPQKSETARTGYWDILSLFRTAGAKSTVQSKTTSGSESG